MASGRLGGVLAGNTKSVVYRSGGYSTASTVVTACSQGGTSAQLFMALRDYDQSLTLDAATYLLHEGNVVTGYSVTLDQTISRTAITPGTKLYDQTSEKSFYYHDVVPAGLQNLNVKAVALTPITFEAQIQGTFAVGEELTNGSATAYIYDVQNIDDTTTAGVIESVVWVGDIAGGTFSDGDTISVVATGVSATIAATGVGTAINHFVYEYADSTTPDYQLFQIANTLPLLTDRTYRFDLSDASLTGLDIKFSTQLNGEWTPGGVAYTTGVTLNGTIGSAGAYLEIDMPNSGLTAGNSLYLYEATTGTAANEEFGSEITGASNSAFSVSDQFTYNGILIYDLSGGDLVINDVFTAGATTYAVTAVNTGAYGYVRRWVPAGPTLHVVLGYNSADFTTSDTFQDSPNEVGADRNPVGITAVTASNETTTDQMIAYQQPFTNNLIQTYPGIVVGHGNSLVVWSNGAPVSVTVNGFTDSTTDWAPTNYIFSDVGGAAAGGAGDAGGGDGVAGG